MGTLQFEYHMTLTYSHPVSESHYTLKCLPRDTDMQRITDLNITITPAHDCQRGTDSFGNLTVYGNLYFPHSYFEVTVTGTAETWLAVSQRCTENTMLFRHPHGLNRPDASIRSYFHALADSIPPPQAITMPPCISCTVCIGTSSMNRVSQVSTPQHQRPGCWARVSVKTTPIFLLPCAI